ncbi:MAG: 4Fe-4S binding protein, partial [Methanobacterium sp.]|nr:4Fe-4S binding protein [Methanobacterium sp.]
LILKAISDNYVIYEIRFLFQFGMIYELRIISHFGDIYQPEIRDDFKWPPKLAASLDMVPSFIAKGLLKFWWTRPAINPEICTNCNRCVKSCPVEALSEGVDIPEFDYPECINCMCCMEMCPEKAAYLEKSLLYRLF